MLLVAEPFFGSGPRLVVTRDRQAASATWSWSAPAQRAAGAGGRATIAAGSGRPDVARDVIEALMVDRGLRARVRSGGRARGARRRVDRPRRRRRSATGRRDLRDAADVHGRPGDRPRLRRRDLGRGARATARRGCGCTSPTCPRTCARDRWSTARPTAAAPACTCRARSSRCCRRRCPTTRARSCPAQDRLAVTVEMVLDGDKVERAASTGR